MTHINWKSEQDKISFIIKEKIAKLDTLINDNSSQGQYYNCQILTKNFFAYNLLNDELDTICLGNEYTYSNSDTVFIYRNGLFYILYDFSAQNGDSWIIPRTYETMCDSIGSLQVVSVGDTIINSEELRYIYVEPNGVSDWVIQGLIIEKIGPVNHYMLPEQNCMTDLMEGGPLRCYHDDFFQFITGIAPYCDYVVSVSDNSNNNFNAYPNPAVNYIIIEYPQDKLYNIVISNILGDNLLDISQVKNRTKIDISMLKAGTYLISLLENNSDNRLTKLLIINT